MSDLKSLLAVFSEVAADPAAELDKCVVSGKKAIGVGPYHVPEELVHAAGARPIGVWGCVGTATEAKRYFPPFYCSICQMTLEMGLTRKLDKLSGIMVTGLCDTLRAFSQNWRAGCGSRIPMIFVANAQNRRCEAGREFTIASYRDVAREVEECTGSIITDEALSASIKLYNEWRAAMREFVKLAGTHPAEVSARDRNAVVDAGYYMDKAEHLGLVKEVNDLLSAMPDSSSGYSKIVLSGIHQDIPAIAEVLDANKFAVAADDLAKESRAFSRIVPEAGDPFEALASGWCALENDSVLYDPGKKHVDHVVELAKGTDAAGVVLLLAKFCDPEEFDAPLIAVACRAAGVPCLTIEVDQSTESYEQARTQFETFAEILG